MRLWSIHPKYLDTHGLLAAWREGLLAKKVLAGHTTGYRNHPQLIRFINSKKPLETIDAFLYGIYEESLRRNYNFTKSKITYTKTNQEKLTVTAKQAIYEFELLKAKLEKRNYTNYLELAKIQTIELHPLFSRIDGEIEAWEKTKPEIIKLMDRGGIIYTIK